MTPPIFWCWPFRRETGVHAEKPGGPTKQAGAPDGRGAAMRQVPRARRASRAKGGISEMAKKTAKGGKKKGGKKR